VLPSEDKRSVGSILDTFCGSYALVAGYMILPKAVELKLQIGFSVALMSSKFFVSYHSLTCHADFCHVRDKKDTVLCVV
jgi:hypothetical protein